MKHLTLYRGITIPSENAKTVIETIRNNGLLGIEGGWKFKIPDIPKTRRELQALFDKPDLKSDAMFSATDFSAICACGTPSGAAYYATQHNFSVGKNDFPLVIEFVASTDDIYVDSRDFLCTTFQLWDRKSALHREWQERILVDLFGPGIRRYFSAACQSSDQSYRIAMCNLTAFDPDVLQGHYLNKKVIAGRYGTIFSSAFFVKTPIEASRVIRIYTPESNKAEYIDISVEGFLNGYM